MPGRRKSGLGAWTRIAVTAPLLLTLACRSGAGPGERDGVELSGEPEEYSGTVVRIVEDGARRETSISREARSGEKRREDWTEQGRNRALIWRPDLGKSFLLDLDGRVYVEIEITGLLSESRTGARNPQDVSSARNAVESRPENGAVQAIDRYFDERQPPTRVEERTLPQVEIGGHSCAVFEQRAIFPDGHAETTRRFRARDLSGLALRVESEAQGEAKVTTERRDVRLEAAPNAFTVPADFKRVEKLTP